MRERSVPRRRLGLADGRAVLPSMGENTEVRRQQAVGMQWIRLQVSEWWNFLLRLFCEDLRNA